MLGFPIHRRDVPVLSGERVRLRSPLVGDFPEWMQLRQESREFLVPWEPSWAPDEFDRSVWRQRLKRYRDEFTHGSGAAFFIFEAAHDRLVGGISLGNIRYGVAQSAQIGYWIGERYAGRGLMVEAVGLICAYAFDRLRLHRIEAACIPDNTRSVRVLEKAGFTREGLLRSYLRINGIWQDHYLYALIAEDRAGIGRG